MLLKVNNRVEKKELKNIRLQMVISQSEKDEIDHWRSKQPDLPSRSEAIRRLVAIGISSQKIKII